MNRRTGTAAKAFQFSLQLPNALLKLRQAVEGSDGLEPLAIVDGGIPGKHGMWRDIAGDAALGGNHRAVSDGEVTGSANLARENAAIANFGGSGEANLAAKHGVGSHVRSMTDDDEVVEFGAAADAGFADGGTIDASIGLDLDVVFKDRRPRLLHLVPGAVVLLGKTKAISADDDSVLQDHAVSDLAEFADRGMGVGKKIISNAGALVNGDEAMQNGVAADVGVFFHDAVGADVRACAYFGGFGDEGRRVESWRVARRLVEEFDGVCKGEVGIGSAQSGKPRQAGVALDAYPVLNKHRRGTRGLEEWEVAPVGEKSNLARLGVFDACDAVDGRFSGAVEAAAELLSNVGEFERHVGSSLPLSASLAQREERSTAVRRYSLNSLG